MEKRLKKEGKRPLTRVGRLQGANRNTIQGQSIQDTIKCDKNGKISQLDANMSMSPVQTKPVPTGTCKVSQYCHPNAKERRNTGT